MNSNNNNKYCKTGSFHIFALDKILWKNIFKFLAAAVQVDNQLNRKIFVFNFCDRSKILENAKDYCFQV